MHYKITRMVAAVLFSIFAFPAFPEDAIKDQIKSLEEEKQLDLAKKAKADAERERILSERKLKEAIDDSADLARARQVKADAEKLAIEAENSLRRAIDAATIDLIDKKNKADAQKQSLDTEKGVAEAQAALDRLPEDLAALAIASRTKRKAAEIGEDLVLVQTLKSALGEPPKVGKEGTLSLSDSKGGFLLRNKVGTLISIQSAVDKLCTQLTVAGVKDAYMTSDGFEAKVFVGQMFGEEVNFQVKLSTQLNGEMKSLQPASVATVVAGLTAARYLVGGISELSKVFRSDFDVAVSENASRSALAQRMTAATCPGVVKISNLEQSLRLTSKSRMGTFYGELDQIGSTVGNYAVKVQAFENAIVVDEKHLDAEKRKLATLMAEYEKAKQEAEKAGKPIPDKNQQLNETEAKVAQLEDQVLSNKNGLATLKQTQKDVERLRAFLDSLKTRASEIADYLVWGGFDAYSSVPHVTLVVTAQDVQVTKDGTFSGKKLSSVGSVELLFVASNPTTGQTITAGTIHETRTIKPIDLQSADESWDILRPQFSKVSK
jgi:hypothetical protein